MSRAGPSSTKFFAVKLPGLFFLKTQCKFWGQIMVYFERKRRVYDANVETALAQLWFSADKSTFWPQPGAVGDILTPHREDALQQITCSPGCLPLGGRQATLSHRAITDL